MKLIRFGPVGAELPGIVDSAGLRRDASAFGEDWNEPFFTHDGIVRLTAWVATHGSTLPVVPDGVRWASCVARPSKIVCVGLNYRDHAAETGAAIPVEPILFAKATSSLVGPFDDLQMPPDALKCDWEVELAIVIGRRATLVAEAQAMEYVAGYALHNDYSERAYQMERGGQWFKGKSWDTFAPLGPWMATADEIPDPHALSLSLSVNGERLQHSSTAQLIFGVPQLVSYISQFMTLLPGDVISTGTPGGVGLGFKPPRYLQHGDVVELSVDGLGTSRQRAVAWEQRAGG
ncbi:MAG: fumarylacetoacetate hydrolase family protein [Gemmatimonadaceae bacterium]|nr:fumarylacetoacetate hydrolase family protein [Gemmatimonadaceae bacterium]